jgi:hypothetical protein
MSNFQRVTHNPIELMQKLWPDLKQDHIIYDENMKNADRDYWVIRQTGHDGTLYFTYEMFMKAFIELLQKQAYTKSNPPDFKNLKDIRYTVGPMKHVTVFGDVYLKASSEHKYPGQRERVRMAVKVDYIY